MDVTAIESVETKNYGTFLSNDYFSLLEAILPFLSIHRKDFNAKINNQAAFESEMLAERSHYWSSQDNNNTISVADILVL